MPKTKQRGRPAKSIEHLTTLIEWAGGRQEFLAATGIHAPNLQAYLAGTKRISLKRLKRCAEQIFGTPPSFVPLVDRDVLPPKLSDIPMQLDKKPGVYALYSSSGTLLYFGKATNLRVELKQTLKRKVPQRLISGKKKTRPSFREISTHFSAYEIPRGDADFRHDVEALVLRNVVNETLNHRTGHFKRKG